MARSFALGITVILVGAMLVSCDSAYARGGLVFKRLDGTIPINQPDLFATALSKAWGDGSAFCTALATFLPPQHGSIGNGVVTSCQAAPYGTVAIEGLGRSAQASFIGTVTLQGTAPQAGQNCPFTEEFTVDLTDQLVVRGTMLKTSSVAFDPPQVTGSLANETWGVPCANDPGKHPPGLSTTVVPAVPNAASDVSFPGSSLNDALQPYQSFLIGALSGAAYQMTGDNGDLVIKIVGVGLVHNKKLKSMHMLH